MLRYANSSPSLILRVSRRQRQHGLTQCTFDPRRRCYLYHLLTSYCSYTVDQMNTVAVAHRETRNVSDKVALFAVRVLRWGLDLVSGYRHDKAKALHAKDPAEADRKYGMTEARYLTRNIFLESVAGVPGMVAGMLRHLHSMRRMKRDHGWIETLLEESYNERMHLLIFLKVSRPILTMFTPDR
jgi:ubiquinol oxidase